MKSRIAIVTLNLMISASSVDAQMTSYGREVMELNQSRQECSARGGEFVSGGCDYGAQAPLNPPTIARVCNTTSQTLFLARANAAMFAEEVAGWFRLFTDQCIDFGNDIGLWIRAHDEAGNAVNIEYDGAEMRSLESFRVCDFDNFFYSKGFGVTLSNYDCEVSVQQFQNILVPLHETTLVAMRER